MAIQLGPISVAHKNQLDSEYPFIWLYEVESDDPLVGRYRFTNYTERIGYRGNTYYPQHVVHGGINTSGDAPVPRIDVAVGVHSLELTPEIDSSDGLVGNPAKVLIVSLLAIDDASAAIEWRGTIEGVVVEENQATIGISGHNTFNSRFPGNVFSRRKCRYTFGDARCGYNIASGNYDRCGTKKDDTIVAAAYTLPACRAIGADEDLNGFPVNHPRRIGSFPGIKPARGTG